MKVVEMYKINKKYLAKKKAYNKINSINHRDLIQKGQIVILIKLNKVKSNQLPQALKTTSKTFTPKNGFTLKTTRGSLQTAILLFMQKR